MTDNDNDDNSEEYDFDKSLDEIEKNKKKQKRTNKYGGGSQNSTPSEWVDPSLAHERDRRYDVPLNSSSNKGRPSEEQKGIPKDERTRLMEYLKYAQEYAYEGDLRSVEKAEGEILEIIKKYEPAGEDSIIYAHYSGELEKLKKIASESAGLDDALRDKLNEENAGSLKELLNRTQEKDKLQSLHSKLSMGALSDAQKITLGKQVQKRSKHFQDLSSITAGFEKVATKADEIQNLINEGARIGDDAIKARNPAKLDRAKKIFEQAINEADIVARQTGDQTEKDRYDAQRFQAEQLLDRYTAVYEQLFKLFRDTEGIGRASVFTERHLKNVQDDYEFRRDDFQSLASLLNSYKVASDEEKGRILKEIDALVRKIEKRHPEAKKSLEKIRANLHSDIDSAIYAATDESERAKELGEATKGYLANGLPEKQNDTRDLVRGRALTGHRHWGSGGSGKMGFFADAGEWIGFDRNPVETFGNLAATILTVWIVITGIVGPILEVFSFFIPFIGILKIPIYIIAIIILHPFMKTILHPIKRDLHFIAGDPYWYEEGTLAEKVRKKTYQRFDEEAGDEEGEEEEAHQRTHHRTPPVKTKKEINKWTDGRVYENKEWKKLPEKQPVKSKKEIKKWAKGRNYGRES